MDTRGPSGSGACFTRRFRIASSGRRADGLIEDSRLENNIKQIKYHTYLLTIARDIRVLSEI